VISARAVGPTERRAANNAAASRAGIGPRIASQMSLACSRSARGLN